MIASRATGTTDPYRSVSPRWKIFPSSRHEIQAFAAKPEHVALYLYQYLMDTTHPHSSVDMAIFAIYVFKSFQHYWKVVFLTLLINLQNASAPHTPS